MGSFQVHTSDGHVLGADLAEAEGTARAAVVVCHPHPQYGGDRFNPVVSALFAALPAAGLRTIRFDFRAAHDGGDRERLDVVAALDQVAIEGKPAYVVGYSFGALVALATADPRLAGIVAVAPPLAAGTPPPALPVLVLSPAHDQFCPPAVARGIVAPWPDATVETIESADHFLVGQSATVADRAAAWLTARGG